MRIVSDLADNPIADIVYLHGIKGDADELPILKEELRKHSNIHCFSFGYEDLPVLIPKIKDVVSGLRSEIPLVIMGLSIGGALSIILGSECKADVTVPINSFYSRSQLFMEKGLGDCECDLKPHENIRDGMRLEIIHSGSDKKIPSSHSIKLFVEATGKKRLHCLRDAEHECSSPETQREISGIILDTIRSL